MRSKPSRNNALTFSQTRKKTKQIKLTVANFFSSVVIIQKLKMNRRHHIMPYRNILLGIFEEGSSDFTKILTKSIQSILKNAYLITARLFFFFILSITE